MKKIVFLVLVGLAVAWAGYGAAATAAKTPEQMVKEAKAAIRELSIDQVKSKIDAKENTIVLDVRDKNELEDGTLPGAMNISRGMLEFKVGMMIPDKSANIVVYCGLDLRGPLATKTLNEMGYANAVNMKGGLKAWKAAGYPVVK